MAKEDTMERDMTTSVASLPPTATPSAAKVYTPPRGRCNVAKPPHPLLSARRKDIGGHRDGSVCPLSPTGGGLGQRLHPRPRLVFDSPRLEYPDDELFPISKELKRPEQRWKRMSELAGDHAQDGSVVRLSNVISPRSLPMGMPQHAAERVRELHLPPQQPPHETASMKNSARYDDSSDDEDDENDTRLPRWLDVVTQTFYNLQHLYLHAVVKPDESENSKRLRRLYVLYRLPGLVSIDGVAVTETERRLARPTSPNRVRILGSSDWLKQRLAEEERRARRQREIAEGSKRNTQAWLSEVLDEKKEADGGDVRTHKHVNVEVDLMGKLTESALTPPNIKTEKPADIIFEYETASSVATADCAWAASCGHFFRPDSMRKQWSKSRLRFSSAPGRDSKSLNANVDIQVPISLTKRESVMTESDHLTVVDGASLSPIMSKTVRPKGTTPPRLVLDASKGSPDRASSLVIKSVPSTAPSMPSPKESPSPPPPPPPAAVAVAAKTTPNSRCPPSRSLSSPFPMQFRARTSPKRSRNKSPPKRILPSPQRATGSPQRVASSVSGKVSPRRESRTGPSSQGDAQTATHSFTITGLSKPVDMKRTKSTPSRNNKGKRDLPPTCPGGGRRLLRTITPRLSKSKFKKQTARNTSIIDDEVDSDEDKEEEETTLVVIGTADEA